MSNNTFLNTKRKASSNTIYILKCRFDKFYVGRTQNVTSRALDHFRGDGSEWTRKYQPIEILDTIYNCDNFDEDKYVKKYMKKYGIDNVRGGSYSQIRLNKNTKQLLQREIWHNINACTRCGRKNHWVKDCFAKTKADGSIIKDVFDNESNSEYDSEELVSDKITSKSDNACFRCGREGHWAENCYAKTDANGVDLYESNESEDEDCSSDSVDESQSLSFDDNDYDNDSYYD